MGYSSDGRVLAQPSLRSPAWHKPGVVVPACNLSTWYIEAGESQVQGPQVSNGSEEDILGKDLFYSCHS